MRGKQKTIQESYPTEATRESPGSEGAHSTSPVDNEVGTIYHDLIEKVLDDGNIDEALKRVVSNNGKPGMDGMTVLELKAILPEIRESMKDSIRTGKYRPKPVRRAEITKPDGGVRNLGIPTAMDRLVQQMIAQVLVPIFDLMFSDSSYGFRPGRSAHDALLRVKDLYDDGYTVVVSLDLSKYFDTIPQDDLMNIIRRTVKDKTLLDLIKRFLKSGVALPNGLNVTTEEGTPQGGPLSPILANIYLDSFDKLMEERNLKSVRYADDINIYVRTPRAAERVMESCANYLEGKLRLRVNREKSAIGSPMDLKFLSFKLIRTKDGDIWFAPHEKAIKRFKDRIREIFRSQRGSSIQRLVDKLKEYEKGWMGYFGTGPERDYKALDAWIRRRMRAFMLKQWKTPKNRQKQLNRIGQLHRQGKTWEAVRALSYRKHVWRAAHQWAADRVLNNNALREETGMYYLTSSWEKVQSRFPKSPLRNRTVGSVGGRQSTLSEFVG